MYKKIALIGLLILGNNLFAETFMEYDKIQKCINLDLEIERNQKTIDIYAAQLMQLDEHIADFRRNIFLKEDRIKRKQFHTFELKEVNEVVRKMNYQLNNALVKKENMYNIKYKPMRDTQSFYANKFEELCLYEKAKVKDLESACYNVINAYSSVMCTIIDKSKDQSIFEVTKSIECDALNKSNPILMKYCNKETK